MKLSNPKRFVAVVAVTSLLIGASLSHVVNLKGLFASEEDLRDTAKSMRTFIEAMYGMQKQEDGKVDIGSIIVKSKELNDCGLSVHYDGVNDILISKDYNSNQLKLEDFNINSFSNSGK